VTETASLFTGDLDPFSVEHRTDRVSNPFGMSPPCERFVPGYGDVNAHFHVVGDHPGVHGGLETGVPFTGTPWSGPFFDALAAAGLVTDRDPDGTAVELDRTYLSFVYPCEPADGDPPPAEDDSLEPFFDAELRAITAHVLLPVGERATRHVLETYTAGPAGEKSLDGLHASEVRGSGWLVVPVADPATWSHAPDDRPEDGDRERKPVDAGAEAATGRVPGEAADLVATLRAVLSRDYRQTTDLGRFLPGGDPYLVR
jgi:uracil-DNA glycosylase family 4